MRFIWANADVKYLNRRKCVRKLPDAIAETLQQTLTFEQYMEALEPEPGSFCFCIFRFGSVPNFVQFT